MKQFKARVEVDNDPGVVIQVHAIEVWFTAANIVQAANGLVDLIRPLGFDGEDISRLIEVDG